MKVTCIKSTSTGMIEGKEYEVGEVSASVLISKKIVVEDYELYLEEKAKAKKARKPRAKKIKDSVSQ